MKKRIPIFISAIYCLFIMHSFCSAQGISSFEAVPRQSKASVSGFIDLVGGTFTRVDSNYFDLNGLNEITSLRVAVIDGELLINYTLHDPSEKNKTQKNYYNAEINHQYYAELTLAYNGQLLYIRPDKIIGHIYNDVGEYGGTKTIVVTKLQEAFVQLEGTMDIELTIVRSFTLSKDPKCEDGIPAFRFAQKVPYVVGGVAGAGMVAAGYLIRNDANTSYSRYQGETDRLLGEQLLEQANDKYQTSRWLIYGGYGILALDATLYIIKSITHKKQTYLYENYCANAVIGINPYFNLPGIHSTQGNVGVSISYVFE